MKNHTENTQGKTGVFGRCPLPPYDSIAEMAAATATATAAATEAPPSPAKLAKGPTLGRYATVLLVAGPFALLSLLLGVCARLLSLPSAMVYVVGYFAGWVAKVITLRIVGNPTTPPAPPQ